MVLIVAVCYILGQREAAAIAESGEEGSVLVQFYDSVNGYKDGFDSSTITTNPATLLTGAAGAAAVAVPLYSAYSSAKSQLTQTKNELTQTVQSYEAKIGDYKQQVTDKKSELDTLTKQAEEKAAAFKTETEKLALEKNAITEKFNSVTTQLETTAKQNQVLQEAIGSEALKNLPGNSVLTLENGNKIATVIKQVIS